VAEENCWGAPDDDDDIDFHHRRHRWYYGGHGLSHGSRASGGSYKSSFLGKVSRGGFGSSSVAHASASG
jgi:hypothetical protein